MLILFVCTGNTCRSPIAAAIARRIAHERGFAHLDLGSAGTSASSSASPEMRCCSSSICWRPRRFFSGRLVVMSARARQRRSSRCVPSSRAKRRTALSVQSGEY